MVFSVKTLVAACALSVLAGTGFAQELKPLNSDTETDRVAWSELQTKFGDVPAAPAGTSIGGVSKTLTNEYWRTLGEGYAAYARKAGVEIAYQAAQSEGDQLGQLSIAENLISQGFDALRLCLRDTAVLEQGPGVGVRGVDAWRGVAALPSRVTTH